MNNISKRPVTRFFYSLFAPKRQRRKAKILGHFDKQSTTYLIWRDPYGKILSEKVVTLAKHKHFLSLLSNQDAFLFGYLLGAEHEKLT